MNWAAPSTVNPGLLDDTLLMTSTWGLPSSISSQALLPPPPDGGSRILIGYAGFVERGDEARASAPEVPPDRTYAGAAAPMVRRRPASTTSIRIASSSYRSTPMSCHAPSARAQPRQAGRLSRPGDDYESWHPLLDVVHSGYVRAVPSTSLRAPACMTIDC